MLNTYHINGHEIQAPSEAVALAMAYPRPVHDSGSPEDAVMDYRALHFPNA